MALACGIIGSPLRPEEALVKDLHTQLLRLVPAVAWSEEALVELPGELKREGKVSMHAIVSNPL